MTNPNPSDPLTLFLVPSLAAVAMLIFGINAFVTNPKRPINQVLALYGFSSLLHFTAMLMGRYEGSMWWTDPAYHNPLPWIRAKWACLGPIPIMSWMLYYLVSGFYTSSRDLFFKLLPWWFVSTFLVILPFSTTFIPADSFPNHVSVGPAYTLYHVVITAPAILLCLVSVFQVKRLTGIKRMEFIQLNIAFALYTIMGFLLPKYFFFSSFLLYAVLAWSITTHRIYHTSRIVRGVIQNLVVLGLVAGLATLAINEAQKFGESQYATWAIIGVAFVVWKYADKKTQIWLNLSTEQHVLQCGMDLKRTGQEIRDPEKLVEVLQQKLAVIGGSKRVLICRHQGEVYRNGQVSIPASLLPRTHGAEEGWFSLSTQTRIDPNIEGRVLASVLETEKLTVLVWPRWTVNTPSIVIAFGERDNQLPYTYPEIIVLRELTEVVETLHTQAFFALQAQQAEQLATIGTIAASVAHEIRQPLSALTTFSELVPKIIKNPQELQDWAKVLPGEGKRISYFVEQLLDLSKPRLYNFERLSLDGIVSDTIQLTQNKATDACVTIINEVRTVKPILGDNDALRQVFLNLVENGIQALGANAGQRVIRIQCREMERNTLVTVSDNGPGIPVEIRERLFQPFVTKGKKGGFGLGLSTCLNIMKAHKGTIEAENGAATYGTAFRLSFPQTS